MTQENPSIISHLSLGTNQFEKARDFYNRVLSTLNIKLKEDYPGAAGYGKQFVEFWLQTPIDGKAATQGNGTHVAFIASNKQQVHDFYNTAIENGATCDGPPGPRPLYTDAYYGCYVRDLDGNKIEATFWDESLLSH
jgi:catechol 2,3-dioxygenase-like lactoylglutathione lyase family enzyme